MIHIIVWGILSALWLTTAIFRASMGDMPIALAHAAVSVAASVVAMGFAFEYGRKRK